MRFTFRGSNVGDFSVFREEQETGLRLQGCVVNGRTSENNKLSWTHPLSRARRRANLPPPLSKKVEADRGEDLGALHRSLPLCEYLHALSEGKKAKAAKIAENGGGGGGAGGSSEKKRNKAKKAEVSASCHRPGGEESGKEEGRGRGAEILETSSYIQGLLSVCQFR